MKVDKKGHTTTLRNTQGDCQAFLEKITNQYTTFQTQNLILDLSKDKTISLKLKELLLVLKTKKTYNLMNDNTHSF